MGTSRGLAKERAVCPALGLRCYGDTPGEALAELGSQVDRELARRYAEQLATQREGEQ